MVVTDKGVLPAAGAAVAVLALALAGCAAGSSGPSSGPSATGTQSPAPDLGACAGRLTAAAVVSAFPAADRANGSFGPEAWSPGTCTVLAADGSVLVIVYVRPVRSDAELTLQLDAARDAAGARPGPTGLGEASFVVDDGTAAEVTAALGRDLLFTRVEGTPASGSRADAAVAAAGELVSWYRQHPSPSGTSAAAASPAAS